MSDQDWDVSDFYQRFQNGEFDGHLRETLESLSPRQVEELQGFVLEKGLRNDTFWKI